MGDQDTDGASFDLTAEDVREDEICQVSPGQMSSKVSCSRRCELELTSKLAAADNLLQVTTGGPVFCSLAAGSRGERSETS